VPANSTHADYDAALPGWIRGRDLLAGEDAVKAAGSKYLPRLDGQTDEDYLAYQARACFSNATRRAADAFVGLVFRKAPFVKIPESQDGIGRAMACFSNDADMLGTSLFGYAKNVVREVISVGRSGTLVDWEGDYEQRAYSHTDYPRRENGALPVSEPSKRGARVEGCNNWAKPELQKVRKPICCKRLGTNHLLNGYLKPLSVRRCACKAGTHLPMANRSHRTPTSGAAVITVSTRRYPGVVPMWIAAHGNNTGVSPGSRRSVAEAKPARFPVTFSRFRF
jgi:hypothetical protein